MGATLAQRCCVSQTAFRPAQRSARQTRRRDRAITTPPPRPAPPATSCSSSRARTGPASCTPSPASWSSTAATSVESQQFGDRLTGRFFMRIDFDGPRAGRRRRAARRRSRRWPSSSTCASSSGTPTAPYRTLIMVSKHLHCLNDLLFRQSTGSLQIEIPAVVSNHPDAGRWRRRTASRSTTSRSRRTPSRRPRRELLRLVDELDVDLVVLARYMQVLSDDALPRSCPGARSTSTTRSCRASRARSPTTRPSTAA